MHPSELLLAVGHGVIIVLGVILTGVVYRAYRRTRERSLRSLAGGFGLLTTGVLVGAVLHGAGIALQNSLLLERGFTALGLAAVVHALVGRARDDRSGPNTP